MVEIETLIERIENSNAPRINEDELAATCIASRKAVRLRIWGGLIFCLGAALLFVFNAAALGEERLRAGAGLCTVLLVGFVGRQLSRDSKLEKALARTYPRIYKRVFPKGRITTFD